MKIPGIVKIGFMDYLVSIYDHPIIDSGDVCYGTIGYESGNISIDGTVDKELQKCVLVHEIVHGIDDMCDIGLTEEQVVKLGKGLYQVIKDNPEMFKED
ncbi:hypothetical protein phiCTP1_gp5 [Clostridium phage phiCTP1]|uniref:hypothetical protein n=1 Tax=Clostridium phage phiCTP1 TaxID=871584 RepID=UPI0001E07813|nr:hypothetical protein phiCTP1_gp5 [Clostridium phage phiCTP1]ADL40306.1 hypothetical phage protein [Clostridium phage phiCTP1]